MTFDEMMERESARLEQAVKMMDSILGMVQSIPVKPHEEPQAKCDACGRWFKDDGELECRSCRDEYAAESIMSEERGRGMEDDELGYEEHESPKDLYGNE